MRIGVAGATHYHVRDWVRAVNEETDVDLVGVWDESADTAAAVAAEGETDVQSDLGRLLDECDAVLIASATTTHADIAVAAAGAGCHMLIEKPMAASLVDLDRIDVAVRDAGVVCAQNFPKRLDAASLHLKSVLAEGVIGQPKMLRARHGHSQLTDDGFRGSWFTDPSQSGGGALLDEGIHLLDFSRWLFGEPSAVFAFSSATSGTAVEDSAVISLHYADGLIADLSASWFMAGADGSVELHGTSASVLIGGVDMASRGLTPAPLVKTVRRVHTSDIANRAWRDEGVVPTFSAGGFHGLGVRDFIAALRDDRPPSADITDARAALRLVEAAYESARTGRAVRFAASPV